MPMHDDPPVVCPLPVTAPPPPPLSHGRIQAAGMCAVEMLAAGEPMFGTIATDAAMKHEDAG